MPDFFNIDPVITAAQRTALAGATPVPVVMPAGGGSAIGADGSPVSGGGTPVTGADVLADTAPASPGIWPALNTFYVADAAAGVDVGTQVVWIPAGHATLPAAKGWRFSFYPSATVV